MPGESSFHRLLWDDAQLLPNQAIKLVKDSKIRRVVLCSGKVYYDLYEEREKRGINDIYLLRVEQLYPFPAKALITGRARGRGAGGGGGRGGRGGGGAGAGGGPGRGGGRARGGAGGRR